MKYGAMNFPVHPIMKEISRIAAMRFDYMELTMDPPCAHFSDIRRQKNEILSAIRDSSLGLVCHLPTFVNTGDLTESIRKASVYELLSSIETAAELKADKLVLHPGIPLGLGVYVQETVKQYALDSLPQMVEAAERFGVTLYIENMPAPCKLFTTPDDFAPVLEQFPTLKMTLDTGHANTLKNRNRSVGLFTGEIGRRIGHVHISDNKGEKDDHLSLGDGNANLKKVAKALKQIGYDDTATLEIFTGKDNDLISSRDIFKRLMES